MRLYTSIIACTPLLDVLYMQTATTLSYMAVQYCVSGLSSTVSTDVTGTAVDAHGRVVGMHSATATPERYNGTVFPVILLPAVFCS